MASQSEQIQNHAQILQEFLSLEKYLLLKFSNLACVCESQALPDEMLKEQSITLLDLKKEVNHHLGSRQAEADKQELQAVLNCFPEKP